MWVDTQTTLYILLGFDHNIICGLTLFDSWRVCVVDNFFDSVRINFIGVDLFWFLYGVVGRNKCRANNNSPIKLLYYALDTLKFFNCFVFTDIVDV